MKNKIGRKTLVIGTVAIVAFSMVGLAAVINYYSDQVTVKGEVNPQSMTLQVRKSGGAWSDTVDFGILNGGDTVTFHMKEHNPNTYDIGGTIHFNVHCDEGFDWTYDGTDWVLGDFDSVIFHDAGSWTYDFIALGTYDRVDDYNAEFHFGTLPAVSYVAGYYALSHTDVEFHPLATGNYTLTAQVLPN